MKTTRSGRIYEFAIIAAIVVVQALVLLMAYRTFSNLNTVTGFVGRPDHGSAALALLRSILTDLSSAERNAKSYYLTRKEEYLSDYFSISEILGEKADRLDSAGWSNPNERMYSDSIIRLVEKQLGVFNRLIELENNERVTEELDMITKRINGMREHPVPNSAVPLTVKETQEKQGFFSRVFGRKKAKPAADTVAGSSPPVGAPQLAEIKRELKTQVVKAGQAQVEGLKKLKSAELELMRDNIRYSERILFFQGEIERNERYLLKNRNKEAAALAAETQDLLTGFGVTIMVMLMLTGVITVMYILQSRQKRRTLRKQKLIAEEHARARLSFLANMSHEIRTPLNSIVGFIDQVLQTDLDEGRKDQLTIAKKSSEHLMHVINNVLDSARMEVGKFTFQKISFSPDEVIRDVVRSMEVIARPKQLRLEYVCETPLPEYIIGDPHRLKQILYNLIGNALKFTSAGFVKVTTACENRQLLLEIRDSGAGIPKNKLGEIFKEFEQSHIAHSATGSGLGLYITRTLVRQQGGSIHIRSKEGQGTTVSIALPFERSENEKAAEPILSRTEKPAMALEGRRVLIVDDEQFNRMLLIAILRKNGLLFEEASGGNEAIATMEKSDFDVVLMDLRMPGMTGFEATMAIRKMTDSRKAAVPVIALTAGLASEKMDKAKQAGMNDFISKPYRESELLEKIAALLGEKKKEE